eukprot:14190368-Heterocapsa_arctica.AAC.1
MNLWSTESAINSLVSSFVVLIGNLMAPKGPDSIALVAMRVRLQPVRWTPGRRRLLRHVRIERGHYWARHRWSHLR